MSRAKRVINKIAKKVRQTKAKDAVRAANPEVLHEFGIKCTPYSYSRLYGQEKYNLQNMLLNCTSFPAKMHRDLDKVYDVYVDRCYNEWRAAAAIVESSQNADAWLAGLNHENFLKFTGKLFALINDRDNFIKRYKEIYGSIALFGDKEAMDNLSYYSEEGKAYRALRDKIEEHAWAQAAEEIPSLPVTGAVAIRFTNASSGYPCEYVCAIVQKSDSRRYDGNSAPFVEHPRSFRDPFGMSRYGYDDRDIERMIFEEDGRY